MKKILIISAFIILLSANNSIAATNMPSAPVKKPSVSKNNTNTSSYYKKNYAQQVTHKKIIQPANMTKNIEEPTKSELDQLSMSMLKAAENRDSNAMQIPFKKMIEKGATKICQPQIIAKRTPTCPPIKIQVNGRQLSGSMCAVTCYEYEGKEYEVGYCK